MKRLFLDCQMGVAGDMLTATLLGLLDNPNEWIKKLNQIGIPKVTYTITNKEDKGVSGYYVLVKINGIEESIEHDKNNGSHYHKNHSDYTHEHVQGKHVHVEHTNKNIHGRSLQEIMDIINKLHISDKCKQNAIAVYNLIAQAESKVHQSTVTQIHFHEVGMLDAIADIVAVCVLLEALAFDSIIVSPIHVGYGTTRCAHGELLVPAPATMELLSGIPMYSDYQTKGELCTPTGAALVKYFATSFGDMPIMTPTDISYGFGTKEFERPNCIRAFVDYTDDTSDLIIEMSCNLDDMTPEEIGFCVDQLLLSPALDVFTTPIMMKKQRLATMLTVLCTLDDVEIIRNLIFKHTTTLGIRYHCCERYVLNRSAEELDWERNKIILKKSSGFGITKCKYEYDSIASIAKCNDMSLLELKRQLLKKEE